MLLKVWKKNYSLSSYFLSFTEWPHAPVEDLLQGDTVYMKLHSHLKSYFNTHYFLFNFFLFCVLGNTCSLFSQPVGPLFNMATSRININIFNHLVWQRNWGAAAVCTATFNSCSEIGWTWLPPFKNILEGKPLLEPNFGSRYNYSLSLNGRQNCDQVI